MERFVFEVIEPLISQELEEERHKERTEKITEELRAFIKGELVPINKELAKKTRELFVASSDVERLKQNLEYIEKECNKLRQELASRESEIFKQKMSFERDIQTLQEELDNNKKQIKKTIKKCEMDIEHLHQSYRDKLYDLKKEHKNELQAKINQEKTNAENEINSLKEGYTQQKSHLIQENSKERSKLIKKYQEKLYTLKNQSDDLLQKTTKDFILKLQTLKKAKSDLENKLMSEQQNSRRLSLELQREISQHRAFKMQFQSTFNELQGNRKRNQQERQRLIDDYESLKLKSTQSDKNLSKRLRELQNLLRVTIEEKDKKYIDTVEEMNTQHRIQIESLQNNMMQEREIAINNVQGKAYEEMFQQIKKYERLEQATRELRQNYNNVKEIFQERIAKAEIEHQQELSALQERKNYEFQLSGQNSKRQYINLQTKFSLELRSLKSQHTQQQENILKKAQEQKIALSNKLISQYEAMLADQRSNTEIQIKQKLLQFQRKAKAYDKRIAQGEKRKAELKVTIERMKLESQMKIQSMMEANEKLQQEIQSLHERVLELQKMKSTIINDYEFQILLLKNETEKLKDEYHQREDELRANLNEKIIVKNKEIARFAERIKQQTEELLKKHRDRVIAIEKEYQELKRVINQKTSLPEDIEALRVFHAAYLEKQNELIAEKRKRQELQRQLHSKDAIEKVFVAKESFKRLTVLDKFAATSGKLSFIRQM